MILISDRFRQPGGPSRRPVLRDVFVQGGTRKRPGSRKGYRTAFRGRPATVQDREIYGRKLHRQQKNRQRLLKRQFLKKQFFEEPFFQKQFFEEQLREEKFIEKRLFCEEFCVKAPVGRGDVFAERRRAQYRKTGRCARGNVGGAP